MLCYLKDKAIRIVNVHSASTTSRTVRLDRVRFSGRSSQELQNFLLEGTPQGSSLELVSYRDGILTLALWSSQNYPKTVSYFAIDVGTRTSKRFLKINQHFLPEKSPLANTDFQYRQHKSYLVRLYQEKWGYRDYQWFFEVHFLGKPWDEDCQLGQFSNLLGSDIGSTVAFEIFDGFLYAVSSQQNLEAVEDETDSFYHCYKVDITQRSRPVEAARVWRREHAEGPINDMWTHLALHRDEATGKLLIIESRHEYTVSSGSTHQRSHYTTVLPTRKICNDDPILDLSAQPLEPSIWTPKYIFPAPRQPNLNGVIPPSGQSAFDGFQHRPRLPCHVHTEQASASSCYTRHKTRNVTYEPSSSTFLDVVSDDNPVVHCADRKCSLRLRVGTRIVLPPLYSNGCLRQPIIDNDSEEVEHSEEQFSDLETRLWPPLDAPAELIELLNVGTPAHACHVRALDVTSDERSIVYQVAGRKVEDKAIVLVGFDPQMNFDSLPRLDVPNEVVSVGQHAGEVSKATCLKARVSDGVRHQGTNKGMFCEVVEEVAEWKTLRTGFRLR